MQWQGKLTTFQKLLSWRALRIWKNVETNVIFREECILKNKTKSCSYNKLSVFYNIWSKTFGSHIYVVKLLFYYCHWIIVSCLCAFEVIVNSSYWYFIISWIKTGVLYWQKILMFWCLQWCQLVTNITLLLYCICTLHNLWTIPSLFTCPHTVGLIDCTVGYMDCTVGYMDCMQTHNIFSCKFQNKQ